MSVPTKAATTVLYIGTKKIAAFVSKNVNGSEHVLSHAKITNPEGFENGFVTHLEKAVASVQQLLAKLSQNNPNVFSDESVYVVLGNSKLRCFSYSSSQYYQGDSRLVNSLDIRNVINQTKSVATIPLNEFILQAIPESFIVNDMNNLRNPLGLDARRLGVNLKIFTMNFEDFRNISNVFESLEIDVQAYFPKLLTVPEAVLNEEEKQQGVLVIDIADDCTQFILVKNGFITSAESVPLGSRRLTELMAQAWEIELHDAERLKEQYATLNTNRVSEEELIPLIERLGVENKQIRGTEFHERFQGIAYEWLKDILIRADRFVEENRIHYPHYVFSGGGASLDGLIEYLQDSFSRVARIGTTIRQDAPHELLVDPSMTPALGLYRWLSVHGQDLRRMLVSESFLQRTFISAKEWFKAYF